MTRRWREKREKKGKTKRVWDREIESIQADRGEGRGLERGVGTEFKSSTQLDVSNGYDGVRYK